MMENPGGGGSISSEGITLQGPRPSGSGCSRSAAHLL